MKQKIKRGREMSKKYADRSPTFVGLRPIIEEGKKGRIEKSQKKHKKDLTRVTDYDKI